MKKRKWLFVGITALFLLAVAGCGNKEPSIDDKEIFEEDLLPLDENELALMEEASTGEGMEEVAMSEEELLEEEMQELSEEEILEEELQEIDEEELQDEEMHEISGPNEKTKTDVLAEDGAYTSRDDVAFYLYTYGKLPANYITEKEAVEMGWDSKNGDLSEIAPGMSIGGDSYKNEKKMLPEKSGRKFYICDVEYEQGSRNNKRIIYSDDGLVFYTENDCETFIQLY